MNPILFWFYFSYWRQEFPGFQYPALFAIPPRPQIFTLTWLVFLLYQWRPPLSFFLQLIARGTATMYWPPPTSPSAASHPPKPPKPPLRVRRPADVELTLSRIIFMAQFPSSVLTNIFQQGQTVVRARRGYASHEFEFFLPRSYNDTFPAMPSLSTCVYSPQRDLVLFGVESR